MSSDPDSDSDPDTDKEETSSDTRTEGVSPAEAFSALGNEVRIKILKELGEQWNPAETTMDSYLSFSDLYDRVGAKNTAQFSYHLDKLKGKFVMETEEGYSLTFTGMKVVMSVLSGTYDKMPEFERAEIEGFCPNCENDMFRSKYENEIMSVECDNCGIGLLNYFLPPSQAEGRSALELVESHDETLRHNNTLAVRGICPECSGKMEKNLYKPEEIENKAFDKHKCVAVCEQCNTTFRISVDISLLFHPAVISFYWQHGVNLYDKPTWEMFEDIYYDWEIETLSENPYEFKAKIELDDSELELILDNNLEVIESRTTRIR